MMRSIVRRLGLAVLITIASPLSPEVGSAQEPMASQPAPVAFVPAPEPAQSHVLVVDAGKAVTTADLEHAFVVVRRRDGRVPRAWLWDEPLGCPNGSSANR